jgi:hypothetical protein
MYPDWNTGISKRYCNDALESWIIGQSIFELFLRYAMGRIKRSANKNNTDNENNNGI